MILLLETVHPDAAARLAEAAEVRLVADPPALDDTWSDGVEAVVTRGLGRIDAAAIDRLRDLRVVARCGAGLDNIDTDAAARAGVAVVHAPGVTATAVAEAATMLMLAAARRLPTLERAVSDGNWSVRQGYEGAELRGRTMGMIGLGDIGMRVAELGAALGMDVVCSVRSPRDVPFRLVSLDELLATSDVIQVCVPLTEETHGLFDAAAFERVKPGVILVNTARGPIVDHVALAAAVRDGRVGVYAADVWDPEPPEVGDPLLADPRTIVTPHVAALTDVTYREICMRTADAVVAVLQGDDPDPRSLFTPRGS